MNEHTPAVTKGNAFMLSNIISAISYADIAFFVVLGLALLGGLIGGLAKSFKGLYKSIAVILISLLLVGATTAPICKIGFVQNMKNSFVDKTAGWGVVFSEPVHIADDGTFYIITTYDNTPTKVKLEDAGGSGLVDRTKGKIALWLADRFITEDGQSLGEAGATMLTTIIVSIAMFIIYCVVLAILCRILRKAFKNMHSSDSSAVRIIDKTLGAVLSAFLALVFLMLVLAILHTLDKTIPAMSNYLTNSPVCGYFYNHNPISQVFQRIFG